MIKKNLLLMLGLIFVTGFNIGSFVQMGYSQTDNGTVASLIQSNLTDQNMASNVTSYSDYVGDSFSFQYPTDWTITQLSLPVPEAEGIELRNNMVPAQIILTSAPQDFIHTNITQEEIDANLGPLFSEHMLKPIISQIQRGTLTELEKPVTDRYTIDGHKAATADYSTVYSGLPTKNIMVGTIPNKDIGFALNYRAPESVFDENLPIVENILNSIRFSG
jgi:hypothetical protein